ncbi:MAG: 1-acyl-sn-glycerol-3-phosphate acyltransferase [Flavobacteriales bacterium]|jgi:acyl-[acyl-carrier-protein]-phospholipid O-acyltransferase/long-chain-fatty-acid--[acyl-carrier-protein] ligase
MKTLRPNAGHRFLVALLRGLARILFRIRCHDSGRIPSTGGALLVVNHVSYLDFLILLAAMPRPVHFVMNGDIYKRKWLKPILAWAGCVPVEPRSGRADLDRFNEAVVRLVRDGHLVALFAEGTVTRTGQLLEFRKGAEHLSSRIQGPVIPVHLGNVIGTPFSYLAGSPAMLRLRNGDLRRIVDVQVGRPSTGQTPAFLLRQRMKELEALNFTRRLKREPRLASQIQSVLRRSPRGHWDGALTDMQFCTLPRRLAILGEILERPLAHHERVAVLLPKSPEALLIYLWLFLNGKCAVPIRPDWNNEERLYVMNQSGARLLITVNDLRFTGCAPVEDEVIYLEDMYASMSQHRELHVACRNIRAARRGLTGWFRRTPATSMDAVFFFRKESHHWKTTALTPFQLLAALQSLRQVHTFTPGDTLYVDLPLYTAFGYVVELLLPLLCDLRLTIQGEGQSAERFAEGLTAGEHPLVVASPEQLAALAGLAGRHNLSGIRSVFCAELDPGNLHMGRLADQGIPVFLCAGSDETASVFAINQADYSGRDIAGKPLSQEAFEPGSIGKPLPGIAIRITSIGDDEVELGRDEPGTVWLSGPAVAAGPAGAWWKTPWTGWLNHRGFLFLITRGDEVNFGAA